MFKRNELRAALARKDMSIQSLAKALNISSATLSLKINGHGDFIRSEIEQIRKVLDLTPEDVLTIFFAEKLA